MRQKSIGHLHHHLARLRRSVEEHQLQRRMKHQVRPRLRPSPTRRPRHLRSAVIGRPNLPLARRVDARQPLQAPRCLHRPLQLLRAAEVDHHRLPQHIEPVLVAMQLVILRRRQPVREHVRSHTSHPASRSSECLQLVRVRAHERQPRPPVQKVAVIRKPAAKLAIGDLPVVDIPVDQARSTSPRSVTCRNAHSGTPAGAAGSVNGGRICSWFISFQYLRPRSFSGSTRSRSVMSASNAVEDIQLPRVHRLLHHVRVVVANLRQPVGHMLRQRILLRLEDQPQHARLRATPRPNSGLAEAIVRYRLLPFGSMRSRVSSHSVCGSPGFTEKLKSSMSRIGQIGSFDLDIHRDILAMRRLDVQRRQIDGDAVQPRVHVLPAIRSPMPLVRLNRAEIRREQEYARSACRPSPPPRPSAVRARSPCVRRRSTLPASRPSSPAHPPGTARG